MIYRLGGVAVTLSLLSACGGGNPASPTAAARVDELPDFGNKGACLTPVDPALATVATETGAGCISCSVEGAEAVLAPSEEEAAALTAFVQAPLAADSGVSVVVSLPEVADPAVTPAGGDPDAPLEERQFPPSMPGFTVSFPDAAAAAGVLPDLTVETLLAGSVVDTTFYAFGFFDSIAVGTFLQDINNATVYLPVEATAPYDAMRLTLSGVAANVMLSVNAHNACTFGVGGSISGDF